MSQTPRPCNPAITQRYVGFLTELLANANTGTKFSPSKLAKNHNVPSFTLSVVYDLGYAKDMSKPGATGTTVVWIPTNHPEMKHALEVHKGVKVIQTQMKRDNDAKHKAKNAGKTYTKPNTQVKEIPAVKQTQTQTQATPVKTTPKKAKITFSGMTVTVPVVNGQIELELDGKMLQINI